MITELVMLTTQEAFAWEDQWLPSTGITQMGMLADVRNLVLGGGAAVAIKPALQFAAVRTERPDAGAAISAGAVITAAGLTPFLETISASDKMFVRRGLSYKLTAGSFARCEVRLDTSYTACGRTFSATQVQVNPTNSTADVSYYLLTSALPTVGVDKAKAAVIGMGNVNSDMEWRLAGRAFNDALAPGTFTELMAGWQTPSSGNFEVNTGEVALTALSPGSFHLLQLALAVRKGAGGDPNSGVGFHVLPALTYT